MRGSLALCCCLLLAACGAPAHADPRATVTPAPPTLTPQRTGTEPLPWPTDMGAYPPPPAAATDLCGHIPDNGAPWYYEDGEGNPRPCPDGTPPPTPEPTPEPALPYRVVLVPVWR